MQKHTSRLYYRVRELCDLTGLSKSKVFQLLRAGKLEGVKIDGTLLITAASIERFLESAVRWKPQRSQSQSEDVATLERKR